MKDKALVWMEVEWSGADWKWWEFLGFHVYHKDTNSSTEECFVLCLNQEPMAEIVVGLTKGRKHLQTKLAKSHLRKRWSMFSLECLQQAWWSFFGIKCDDRFF